MTEQDLTENLNSTCTIRRHLVPQLQLAEDFEKYVTGLGQYNRPILCTEYMARSAGSTFDTILPIAEKHNVAAINWRFVAGKIQTNLPWDS